MTTCTQKQQSLWITQSFKGIGSVSDFSSSATITGKGVKIHHCARSLTEDSSKSVAWSWTFLLGCPYHVCMDSDSVEGDMLNNCDDMDEGWYETQEQK